MMKHFTEEEMGALCCLYTVRFKCKKYLVDALFKFFSMYVINIIQYASTQHCFFADCHSVFKL